MIPLRDEKISGHIHKAGVWYLLWVLFQISDKQCHSFYIGVPPGDESICFLGRILFHTPTERSDCWKYIRRLCLQAIVVYVVGVQTWFATKHWNWRLKHLGLMWLPKCAWLPNVRSIVGVKFLCVTGSLNSNIEADNNDDDKW